MIQKIMKIIKNENNYKELKKYINKIHAWIQRQKPEFNVRKCHMLEIG